MNRIRLGVFTTIDGSKAVIEKIIDTSFHYLHKDRTWSTFTSFKKEVIGKVQVLGGWLPQKWSGCGYVNGIGPFHPHDLNVFK